GGFVEVKDNQVIMLADVAELASEIDPAEAERDRGDAEQRLSSAGDDGDPEAEVGLRWAQARIEAAPGEPGHSLACLNGRYAPIRLASVGLLTLYRAYWRTGVAVPRPRTP